MQRRLGLIPAAGLGAGRRALLAVALAWGPIAAALWLAPSGVQQPSHFQLAIHVRCLIALPLLILGEQLLHASTARVLKFLRRSELVAEAPLATALAATARLRDMALPWVIALLIVELSLFQSPCGLELRELAAISSGGPARLAFASAWYLFVARPLIALLLLGWLWRLGLWAYLLWRLSRLPLALVPTHPDRAFGLGFLERAPAGFVPLLLATSSTLSAAWAHGVLHHGVSLASLLAPALTFVLFASGLVLGPLLVFALPLSRAKLAALPDYAALVAEHGRKVRQRWILHTEPSAPALLEAPELGPVADTISLFNAVACARPVPIGKLSLLIVGVPLLLPLAALALCKTPLRELLIMLLRSLV